MEFNKFISASMLIGSLALVSCGDEQKKEADKVEVTTNTVTTDLPKTDVPATEPATSELPKVEVAPVPESDAPRVDVAPTPEEPKHDVVVESHSTESETKTETTH